MINKNEITSRGIANQKGLEVFRTAISYSGEFINWGNALAYGTQLGSDVSTVVSGDVGDAQVQALILGAPSNSGQWLRFQTTTGTNHYVGTPPTSGSGFFTLNAASSGAKLSYAGMYQKMSLITGTEYEIQITNTIDTDSAALNVTTYYPMYDVSLSNVSYKINSTAVVDYPLSSTSTCILTSTFTAKTPNDIIMIYLTTTSASAAVNITNISVKEKLESLIPVYSEDAHGNAEKVLRRNISNPTFNT